ncbi:MAG TPA: FAD:protein FMN transferase [Bacilli bacterium]|nr:FAD:protein FMN transferase [Bacilli bacterium]HPZ23397.1 FAD:protein FMN transferase [Bacilli bacterium]HQC83452.1 FAD:protein FMN transferase [Bacilli bacterium]
MINIKNLYVFGTIVNLEFAHNAEAEQEILTLLYKLDDLCSIYKDTSDVTHINESLDYVPVDAQVYNIIKKSLTYSNITDGYGDITIKPLIDAIHNKKKTKDYLTLVNYKNIMLKEPNLVKLGVKGMSLDLGSMVKGYATDKIVDILNKYNIDDAIIDLGGNIFVKGNFKGEPWKVGIQDPFKKTGEIMGYLNLSNKSIVTSGTNERGNHIINPKDGRPATSIKSITIIADSSFDAEGLSTGFFVQGISSLNTINNLNNIDAIIIDKHHHIYLSNNLKNKLIITNSKFHIKECK